MRTDVRDLLAKAAAEPASELDVDAVVDTARRRHRRTRIGIAVGCVAAVAAVAGGLALRSEDGSVQVAAGLRQAASTVPDGWTELNLRDAGIALAIPPGWVQFERRVPAGPGPTEGTTASEAVVVGSAAVTRTGEISACTEVGGQTPDVPGTWVSLYEIHGSQLGTGVVLPTELSGQAVIDRPADFRTVSGTRGTCGTSASYEIVAFQDAGRVFLARMVTTDAKATDLGIGAQILNTLRVDPATAETPVAPVTPEVTTTTPTPTPAPTPTAPPLVVNNADEAAVRDVFLAWIDAQPRSALDDVVEDFASIRAAHEEGVAQHSADDLAKYAGRVDSVRIVDDTHADVVYSVLFNGVPQFALRPGEAIKIDGVWKVSRDTVCDLLKLGGITCPPRDGP
jgi:hypothetical protein